MIKELRAARGEFQQLEAVHTEKKNNYDQIKLKYDMEFEVLNTDSDGCRVSTHPGIVPTAVRSH